MNDEAKKYYLFSPSLRIAHWVWALAISVLFITGIYIGDPFFIGNVGYSATFGDLHALTMNYIRFLHFSFGYILLSALVLRFLIMPFRKADRLIIPKFWTKEYWENAFDTLKNYLFITKSHRPYVRNPLARSAYLGLFLLLIFEVITGFAMYGRSNPGGFWDKLCGWIIPMLGGEYQVHRWHHIVAWIIVLFVVIHVYMVVREDILEKDGEVSSMVNGNKFFEHTPADITDI
ncbi:Ni/Fe-hydrogenase, b-type cytochrome subunit [Hydrogenobaculum acidophilum]